MVLNKRGGEKMICRNCGQEFTPKRGSESKGLCPKCFIQKLDHLAANNSVNDPAAKTTMMDQPTDPQKPEPTMPGTPPEPPAAPPTGQEPTPPEPVTPTPGMPTPAPGGEEPAGGGAGEPPAGGETPPAPPMA